MNIVEATQIIQEQADANGRTFTEEVIYISENLRTASDEVYNAWTTWHKPANDYMSHGFNKARIEQLARDVKNLSLDQSWAKEYFDSLTKGD